MLPLDRHMQTAREAATGPGFRGASPPRVPRPAVGGGTALHLRVRGSGASGRPAPCSEPAEPAPVTATRSSVGAGGKPRRARRGPRAPQPDAPREPVRRRFQTRVRVRAEFHDVVWGDCPRTCQAPALPRVPRGPDLPSLTHLLPQMTPEQVRLEVTLDWPDQSHWESLPELPDLRRPGRWAARGPTPGSSPRTPGVQRLPPGPVPEERADAGAVAGTSAVCPLGPSLWSVGSTSRRRADHPPRNPGPGPGCPTGSPPTGLVWTSCTARTVPGPARRQCRPWEGQEGGRSWHRARHPRASSRTRCRTKAHSRIALQ